MAAGLQQWNSSRDLPNTERVTISTASLCFWNTFNQIKWTFPNLAIYSFLPSPSPPLPPHCINWSVMVMCSIYYTRNFYFFPPYFLGAFTNLQKATVSFFMFVYPSVCVSVVHMDQMISDWTDLYEIWCLVFFEFLSRKFKYCYNMKRIMGTLLEDVCTFMTIYRSALLIMRNILGKVCREN